MSASGYHSHARPQMRRFVPAEARILLDVGCGDGAFAAGLREERPGGDLQIWGLELDPDAGARAQAHLHRVLIGPAQTTVTSLPAATFDCVVLNDVLEHMAWPEEFLRALHRVLRPGGVLVASIPNVRYFPHLWGLVVRGDWEYRDEGILDRTHLRFFTRQSMQGLFARSGFALRRQEGINPTGSWRFRAANLLTAGRLADTRYLQYACVAEPLAEARA